MKVLKSFALAIFALCLSPVPQLGSAQQREIAITFDDAPRSDGPLFSGAERTVKLVEALEEANVSGAMFFANTNKLQSAGEEGYERLRRYAAAGHFIANHTHSHQSANSLEPEAFLADVDAAHQVLSVLPGFEPFVRFPFLHEGRPVQHRDALRRGLTERGLQNGYVTVDNYDWYLQALAKQHIAQQISLGGTAKESFDYEAWRQVYVDVLVDAVQFYDAIAVSELGRSPPHVLLLHENDLAALYIGDLVRELRKAGWKTISALKAYADPMAQQLPETLFLGQGRVAALAHDSGAAARHLISALEDEKLLRAELVRRQILQPLEGSYLAQRPPGDFPEVFAAGVISLADQHEYGSVFSADGLTMYFGVQLEGRAEIRTTRYEGEGWTAPEAVVSHPVFTFGDPFLSPDESRLYFISNQPLTGDEPTDTMNIGFVERRPSGWSEPAWLGAPVNTSANEFYVSFTANGEMAFASNAENERKGNLDIYLARGIEQRGRKEISRVPYPVNTGAYDADPFIAADGSYIIFGSTRRPGLGHGDLYVSFKRDDGSWGKSVSLGNKVNTPEHELCPFVSKDGRYVFYTSNQDIYWVSSSILEPLRAQSLASDP